MTLIVKKLHRSDDDLTITLESGTSRLFDQTALPFGSSKTGKLYRNIAIF